MSLQPRGVYSLEVPPGDVIIDASRGLPGASFHITMAAIDPSQPPSIDSNGNAASRSTLKLLRQEEDYDEEYLRALMGGADSDSGSEESSEEDEDDSDLEPNGGPSDPAKVFGARAAARMAQLKKEEADSEDEEMADASNGINGALTKRSKGKAKALGLIDDSSSEGSDEDIEFEKAVLCTLDTEKTWQQPLDILIDAQEQVFFQVTGSHPIYLSGNYVHPAMPQGLDEDESDEDEDYYDIDEEEELSDSEESDELDDLEDPRIREIVTDEEDEVEEPKLIKANGVSKKSEQQKGKNKRPAEDDDSEGATTLDDLIAKSIKPDAAEEPKKLSKKQQKKLKNNAGQAVSAVDDKKDAVKSKQQDSPANSTKSDKKVQFAEKLEQGPSKPAKEAEKKSAIPEAASTKPADKKSQSNIKTVDGVKMEDKKVGSGKAAKKGDRVSMRYIGKLTNGTVFDSNTKGKPFGCKLGTGEVIKGWDIGVAGMAVGGERRITVPAHLAYGSKALPGIPPNSVLTFEIKMIDIKR